MEELLTNPATFGVFIQLFKLGLDFSKSMCFSIVMDGALNL